jgi:DivIVA domain-containing protein
MADFDTTDVTTRHFRRGERASDMLRDISFPTAVRGYDRRAVDDFLQELLTLVADLEARQTREGVVQKALDELGEETAGILQRAHETADEIAARSRAQADGRLQRAEREAEIAKRDADEYAEQVVSDTRLLWDERQRLIEDIRHLADEVLATADDAIERLKLPDPLAAAEEAAAEDTTAEEAAGPIPHPLSIARQADPSVPYDLEDLEDEPTDPEPTAAWQPELADEDVDPDATAPYAIQGDDELGEEGEEEGSHTVELEALPGGNSDDPAAETEPDPEQRD